jgi:hypothetical protein
MHGLRNSRLTSSTNNDGDKGETIKLWNDKVMYVKQITSTMKNNYI